MACHLDVLLLFPIIRRNCRCSIDRQSDKRHCHSLWSWAEASATATCDDSLRSACCAPLRVDDRPDTPVWEISTRPQRICCVASPYLSDRGCPMSIGHIPWCLLIYWQCVQMKNCWGPYPRTKLHSHAKLQLRAVCSFFVRSRREEIALSVTSHHTCTLLSCLMWRDPWRYSCGKH